MPNPKDVFESPDKYWDFLTIGSDTDFEAQHFERKESCSAEDVQTVISAFANENKQGGLLVIGIAKDGAVKGLGRLSDIKRNRLTNINDMLVNQAARVQTYDCQDDTASANKIILVYVPNAEHGICETRSNPPESWLRRGSTNNLMTDSQREQLRRDKRIVDFEQSYCCTYNPADLDRGVLDEFRGVYLASANYVQTDPELLYHTGALDSDIKGQFFTKAGFLFFAANPQRVLPHAYIRLLRFDTGIENAGNRGLPTFERKFSGPLTQQIRELRAFFRQSGFFKVYQRRNSDGSGFVEEPEFPMIAVDEAIVNAVAHRDYAPSIPIECESYKDAFVVRNPGRLQQRDRDMPERFSLDTTTLVSTPRNPKLIEWLKLVHDEQGAEFVRAIHEGTRRMREEMSKLGLPPPLYEISEAQTTVILYNNAAEREARLRVESAFQSSEFTNLYPIEVYDANGQKLEQKNVTLQHRDIMVALGDALAAKGWYIDVFKFGRIVAHRRGSGIDLPQPVARLISFFPAYSFQFRSYWDKLYLCLDYTLEVKNTQPLKALRRIFNSQEFIGSSAIANWSGWHRCRIVAISDEYCRVHFFDFAQDQQLPLDKVVPNLSKATISALLELSGVHYDLARAIKQHSLALEPGAARGRAEKSQAIANDLAQSVFPLRVNGVNSVLLTRPAELVTGDAAIDGFRVYHLPEPTVEFNQHLREANIRDGITKFGSYDPKAKTIELVPFCTPELRDSMASLISRLKSGQYKYHGSERTFKTRISYTSIVTVPSAEDILGECKRLVDDHPEWAGDGGLGRLFLVHTPEAGYASDDEQSPYYKVKRFLLEKGIPCQMVDTPTLNDPNWKDLNLALNIIAKCGVTPWVLPDVIPDADFFIGISYTMSGRRGSERLMGYAHVFNQYGRWMFYSGSTSTYAYDEREKHFGELIKDTLKRLSLSETPSIYFHYSAKFSHDDRAAIVDAARSVKPNGVYSFVWINAHHNVRLYDNRAETDGSLSRGSYVLASPNQIYLSTTGYNPYRKALGTPLMLEVSIQTERPEGMANPPPDLKALAIQILSLTKLNWASTDSLCGEPITTKYAGDIAYLTSAFLRQGQSLRLHPVLEKTPWFI